MNNNYDKIIKYSEELAPSEKEVVDEDLINLPRIWCFWEGYESKEEISSDWTNSFKRLIAIKDLIMFWQFWNNTIYSNFAEIFFNGSTFKLYLFCYVDSIKIKRELIQLTSSLMEFPLNGKMKIIKEVIF